MTVIIRTDADADNHPSAIIFDKFAFFTDSKNNPSFCDKNNSYVLNHQTPTETPTETHASGSSMSATAGGHKYKTSEYNINTSDGIDTGETDDDMFSGQETNLSPASTITGNFTNKDVTVTVSATALNSDATHKKIYGTEDGGSIYYYLGYVEVGTTTFTDNNITRAVENAAGELKTLSDGSTLQTELHYPIEDYAFLVPTKTRIVGFGSKTYSDGTVSVTNGSPTITGTSTTFTRIMENKFFQVDDDTRKYRISGVSSATSIGLQENYAGITDSGLSYELSNYKYNMGWSAKHPLTSQPMWWAFPLDHKRKVINHDGSPIMGANKMGNKPVCYKRYSYTLFTENGNDFIPQDSKSGVGTCSHHSIVETSTGSNLFMTYEGLIYEATGITARDLDIDLSKTIDGLNASRLPYVQGAYLNNKNWAIWLYTSSSGTIHDRMLVLDTNTMNWFLLEIDANCIAIISVSGEVDKPWIGTEGGFVYKMLSGNNMGGGTEANGTLTGTITSSDATTLTDSTATFYTTDDGQKDVYVYIYDTDDVFVEKQKIVSNTADTITVTAWDTTPTTGYTYEIGSNKWKRESKVFDFGIDNQKTVNDVLVNFKKTSSQSKFNIAFYFSQDPDMVGDTSYCKISFYTNINYYEPQGLYDNVFRYMKYEIYGHGVNDPITISSIMMDIEQHFS